MREVRATGAKSRLAEILRQVEAGETIAISRYGTPIASLIPVPIGQRARWVEAMERLMQARSQWQPTGMSRAEILAARHAAHRA